MQSCTLLEFAKIRLCVGMRREDDAEMATENAIAALGKLLEAHGGLLEAGPAAQSWALWLQSLPLTEGPGRGQGGARTARAPAGGLRRAVRAETAPHALGYCCVTDVYHSLILYVI